MEIAYLIIPLLSLILGLICGSIVSYIAKEELKPGKKYFWILHHILLAAIIAAIITTIINPKYFFITASLIFIYGFPTASLLLLDRNKK